MSAARSRGRNLKLEVILAYQKTTTKRPIKTWIDKHFSYDFVDLSGQKLDVENLILIRNLLIHNNTILELNLENCELDADAAALIAHGLCYNKTLLRLNLKNNNIDNEGLNYFKQALRFNKTILEIKLDKNNLLTPQNLRELRERLIRNISERVVVDGTVFNYFNVYILGDKGSGKSSLLLNLLGIKPEAPATHRLFYNTDDYNLPFHNSFAATQCKIKHFNVSLGEDDLWKLSNTYNLKLFRERDENDVNRKQKNSKIVIFPKIKYEKASSLENEKSTAEGENLLHRIKTQSDMRANSEYRSANFPSNAKPIVDSLKDKHKNITRWHQDDQQSRISKRVSKRNPLLQNLDADVEIATELNFNLLLKKPNDRLYYKETLNRTILDGNTSTGGEESPEIQSTDVCPKPNEDVKLEMRVCEIDCIKDANWSKEMLKSGEKASHPNQIKQANFPAIDMENKPQKLSGSSLFFYQHVHNLNLAEVSCEDNLREVPRLIFPYYGLFIYLFDITKVHSDLEGFDFGRIKEFLFPILTRSPQCKIALVATHVDKLYKHTDIVKLYGGINVKLRTLFHGYVHCFLPNRTQKYLHQKMLFFPITNNLDRKNKGDKKPGYDIYILRQSIKNHVFIMFRTLTPIPTTWAKCFLSIHHKLIFKKSSKYEKVDRLFKFSAKKYGIKTSSDFQDMLTFFSKRRLFLYDKSMGDIVFLNLQYVLNIATKLFDTNAFLFSELEKVSDFNENKLARDLVQFKKTSLLTDDLLSVLFAFSEEKAVISDLLSFLQHNMCLFQHEAKDLSIRDSKFGLLDKFYEKYVYLVPALLKKVINVEHYMLDIVQNKIAHPTREEVTSEYSTCEFEFDHKSLTSGIFHVIVRALTAANPKNNIAAQQTSSEEANKILSAFRNRENTADGNNEEEFDYEEFLRKSMADLEKNKAKTSKSAKSNIKAKTRFSSMASANSTYSSASQNSSISSLVGSVKGKLSGLQPLKRFKMVKLKSRNTINKSVSSNSLEGLPDVKEPRTAPKKNKRARFNALNTKTNEEFNEVFDEFSDVNTNSQPSRALTRESLWSKKASSYFRMSTTSTKTESSEEIDMNLDDDEEETRQSVSSSRTGPKKQNSFVEKPTNRRESDEILSLLLRTKKSLAKLDVKFYQNAAHLFKNSEWELLLGYFSRRSSEGSDKRVDVLKLVVKNKSFARYYFQIIRNTLNYVNENKFGKVQASYSKKARKVPSGFFWKENLQLNKVVNESLIIVPRNECIYLDYEASKNLCSTLDKLQSTEYNGERAYDEYINKAISNLQKLYRNKFKFTEDDIHEFYYNALPWFQSDDDKAHINSLCIQELLE